MLDPTPPLGSVRFRPVRHSHVAGRATVTAEGFPRPEPGRGPRSFELHELGLGADHYTLEVDAERGAPLDVVALREVEPFHRVSTLETSFDEPIADERFVFVPPRGGGPPGGSPHEARARTAHRGPAARTVHRAHAGDVPRRELHCRFASRSSGLRCRCRWQFTTGPRRTARTSTCPAILGVHHLEQYDLPLAGEQWKDVTRDGTTLRVNSESARGSGPRQAQACVARDGAFVFLTSDTLSTEQLTRIAAGLVPAPSTSGV